jgi:hypothetical protein
MPSEYGDLSRLALEADLDVDDLPRAFARMSDRELLELGRAAVYMCTPRANLGQPRRKPFVLQLEAARAEWRCRHGHNSVERQNLRGHERDIADCWNQWSRYRVTEQ